MKKAKNDLKVVAITSCSVGIAHTYMNATAMENIAKKYDFSIHVEKQGQLGPEDVISSQEFAEADVIILCCGVAPLEPERFECYPDKIVEVEFDGMLKKPQMMEEKLKEKGVLID